MSAQPPRTDAPLPHIDTGRPVVTSHVTSWHDGGVALLTPRGDIVALSSERIADRRRHNWDSRLAYDYLRTRLPAEYFGGAGDYVDDAASGLERDGHHLYHAASTYFAAGGGPAAVLVLDSQGPAGDHLSTTTIWRGLAGRLELLEDLNTGSRPFAARSLGHFYTAVSALAGFRELFAEGKTMALASYGRPSPFLDLFGQYIQSHDDGTYQVDPALTLCILGNTLGPALYDWPPPSEQQVRLWDDIGALRRAAGSATWPTQDDMDIAFAGQFILNEVMVGLARRARELTRLSRLCLAGGVALNCVANEKVRGAGLFDEVFVVPAPGDDGQALGRLYQFAPAMGRTCPPLRSAYLGPVYHDSEVLDAIQRRRSQFSRVFRDDDDAARVSRCARLLARGQVIGWFQGRSELGPRALGHRSILASPRSARMRSRLNRMKQREWFRPVAPMVPDEAANTYFHMRGPSPFMSFAVSVRPDRVTEIPAAVHCDGTARVQTVSAEQEPTIHQLLWRMPAEGHPPVLLNTSFNRRNEPIVETPEDAISSFLGLGLDYLVIGPYVIEQRS